MTVILWIIGSILFWVASGSFAAWVFARRCHAYYREHSKSTRQLARSSVKCDELSDYDCARLYFGLGPIMALYYIGHYLCVLPFDFVRGLAKKESDEIIEAEARKARLTKEREEMDREFENMRKQILKEMAEMDAPERLLALNKVQGV